MYVYIYIYICLFHPLETQVRAPLINSTAHLHAKDPGLGWV